MQRISVGDVQCTQLHTYCSCTSIYTYTHTYTYVYDDDDAGGENSRTAAVRSDLWFSFLRCTSGSHVEARPAAVWWSVCVSRARLTFRRSSLAFWYQFPARGSENWKKRKQAACKPVMMIMGRVILYGISCDERDRPSLLKDRKRENRTSMWAALVYFFVLIFLIQSAKHASPPRLFIIAGIRHRTWLRSRRSRIRGVNHVSDTVDGQTKSSCRFPQSTEFRGHWTSRYLRSDFAVSEVQS